MTLTVPLVLALAVLAIFPLLVVFSAFFLVVVVLHRMNQTQQLALENLDRMARKVCAMSEKPSAQQLALTEAARSLSEEAHRQKGPTLSEDSMMAQ